MLYTKKGDRGTTKLFNCPPGVRLEKSALIFEALGAVDHLNSSIGFAKALVRKAGLYLMIRGEKVSYEDILNQFQEILFIIQAELGGAAIHAEEKHTHFLEDVIAEVEKVLLPIKSFTIPGGGESGAYLDVARTIARQAERKYVSLKPPQEEERYFRSLEFLNRLSSALFALSRHANYQEGFVENSPHYK